MFDANVMQCSWCNQLFYDGDEYFIDPDTSEPVCWTCWEKGGDVVWQR